MSKTHLLAILYGWIACLIFILLTSAIIAFSLKYTNIAETTFALITLSVGIITLFIGGFIAGIKAKEKGWLIGLIIGLGFTLLIFFIQYLGINQAFTLQQTLYHITYVLVAMFGAIIGVNISNLEK